MISLEVNQCNGTSVGNHGIIIDTGKRRTCVINRNLSKLSVSSSYIRKLLRKLVVSNIIEGYLEIMVDFTLKRVI